MPKKKKKKTTRSRPVGSVCAIDGALTLVLLDGSLTEAWEPLLEEPEDDDVGGHPQKVIELLEADEAFTSRPLTVGGGKALVLSLEAVSGEAEVYRLPDGALALVEPTRSWWDDEDNYGKKTADVQAMFAEAIGAPAKAAPAAGKVAMPSGKLVVFDASSDLSRASKTLKKPLVDGVVKPFGVDGDGLVIALPPGTVSVRRQVFAPKWAKGQELVVAYLVSTGAARSKPLPAKKKPTPAKKAVAAKKHARRPSAAKTLWKPSAVLAAVVGSKPLTSKEVCSVWAYIMANKLQVRGSPTRFKPDAKLKKIFDRDQLSLFEMADFWKAHLT